VSIREEFEAVDWYDQRVDATNDADLAAVLAHTGTRRGTRGHDLEWLRRNDSVLSQHMRTYLFTTEPVTEVEAEAEEAASGDGPSPAHDGPGGSGSLGIGSLKGVD